MNTNTLLIAHRPIEMGISLEYFLGAMIALLLFGYLIFSLIKPEKF